MNIEETVADLGESGVLNRVLAKLGEARQATLGPGDDCAVLEVDGELVVTTDTMIEGPDFRLDWHSGFQLGWKLATTNLSDVAAMGATPSALTMALACPQDTPVRLLEEIAAGLDAACAALAPGCGVVGGDLGTAPVLFGAVTALGEMQGRAPVTRSGAKPGDVVAYAGQLGLSGLGLELLVQASAAGTMSRQTLHQLTEQHSEELRAHLTPTPPVSLGVAAAHSGATAMMDVSDGLSLDAARLAAASSVSVAFDSALLDEHFGTQNGVIVPLQMMLTGGEDHGLLATFPLDAALPEGFLPIGEVRATDRSHPESPLILDGETIEPRGWDPYTVRDE